MREIKMKLIYVYDEATNFLYCPKKMEIAKLETEQDVSAWFSDKIFRDSQTKQYPRTFIMKLRTISAENFKFPIRQQNTQN